MKKIILLPLFSMFFFLGCTEDKPCTTCPSSIDTTSHAFTWQAFTWGGGGGSSITDIAILSDTNIWAVGNIQLPDSVAMDSAGHNFPYGIAHWDGKNWTLQRIFYHDYGTTEMFAGGLTSILAFASNDIYVCSYANLLHWDGNSWTEKAFFITDVSPVPFNGQVQKMWGSDGNHIYCVGKSGAIYFYNGSSWQKLESGTTLDLHDIYGATDSKTGEQQILAVGSSNIPFDRVILRIQGSSVTKLSSAPIEYELISVWFSPNQHYYVVGDGVFEKKSLSENSWKNSPLDITTFGMSVVRGNNLNDVFCVGSFLEIIHYNGSTWYNYSKEIPHDDGALGALDIKGNIVVVAGQLGQDAIVMMGKR
ncbi:MAG: hypothetical protein WCT99_03595 [Bacteroidota bacterium]|jgi:hypothetical protein